MIAEAGKGEFWLSGFSAFRTLGPKSGLVSAEEAEAVVADLERLSEEGVFFGACSYYAYILERPV